MDKDALVAALFQFGRDYCQYDNGSSSFDGSGVQYVLLRLGNTSRSTANRRYCAFPLNMRILHEDMEKLLKK
eukprot:4094531-Prorocentrum_lima.AAC.1